MLMNDSEATFANAANLLTLFRIVIVPLFIITALGQSLRASLAALIIFAVAALSDCLDGFLARRYNLHTQFGEFVDPLADKILVCSAFIVFIFLPFLHIPLWIVLLILLREIFITSMRTIALRKGKGMKTEYSGKIKAFFQMVSIFIILALYVLRNWVLLKELNGTGADFWMPLFGARGAVVVYNLPRALVAISAVLALVSMIHYIVKNRGLFSQPPLRTDRA
jgi:CDP-diacylglycerol--glycerol-3-phosphate 3-phosphatidyltransferase